MRTGWRLSSRQSRVRQRPAQPNAVPHLVARHRLRPRTAPSRRTGSRRWQGRRRVEHPL